MKKIAAAVGLLVVAAAAVAALQPGGAGAVDPLDELAGLAESEGLWLHVDAAWGGAAAFVPELQPLLAGIERADSITFDAHKWLSVPMGAGFYLTRPGDLLEPRQLAVIARGATPTLKSERGAVLVVLGGEPLDGPRYMWWNFVSSDKDRILAAANAWRTGGFATIPGDDKEFIPLPEELPHWTTQ